MSENHFSVLDLEKFMLEKIASFIEQLTELQQRRLIVIAGQRDFQFSVVQYIVSSYQGLLSEGFFGLSWNKAIDGCLCVTKNYRHHLGRETNLVVFDDDAFHPDAFAALSGTLKVGGLLVWLPSQSQQHTPDPFIKRIWQLVNSSQNHIYLEEGQPAKLPNLLDASSNYIGTRLISSFKYGALTQDQQNAVEAIVKVATGHSKRPLVLTADRGRGKSTALAIACKELLNYSDNKQCIAICAPNQFAVDIVFFHLQRFFPQGKKTGSRFEVDQHLISFMPIDVLLNGEFVDTASPSLVLVDEAAAIPIYLLKQLTQQFSRLVFSTTQHGYEGAGRGFTYKFVKELKENNRQTSELHLTSPIRWREGDPLEKFTFDAFLLSAKTAVCQQLPESGFSPESLKFRQVAQKELLNNKALLEQVFATLVTAHYQTSPSDLKLLLNNPSINIFVGYETSFNNILSVALIAEEGNSEASLSLSKQRSEKVLTSESQLKNQFIPQSLVRHLAFHKAFDYYYWRVIRIAVVPEYQQSGIGTQLLQFVEQQARQVNVDVLGTSFGLSVSLYHFWSDNGLHPVRLGVNKDKASGEYSVLMLNPLVDKAKTAFAQLFNHFDQSLAFNIPRYHQDMHTLLVISLLIGNSVKLTIEQQELCLLEAFKSGNCQFAQSAYVLNKWFTKFLANASKEVTTLKSVQLLADKLILQRDDKSLAGKWQLTGKKQVASALRQAYLALALLD